MFITMGVSLYTSRVVLNVLGIEDYGVYSIVGGVVLLFGFFNSAMSSATQRFLAFDIGRNDKDKLRNTFNATFLIHIGIALLILLLAETIGLWFVNDKLDIPPERMNAAIWVYQLSVLTFLIGVIQVPFTALIIAREQMNIYAVISIVEVMLKLVAIYLLVIIAFDKLVLYAVLIFLITILIASLYRIYCLVKYEESKFKIYYDKSYFYTLISYSGWNLFGNIAVVASGQGVNIVLNLFFGTIVNAAYGVMLQVQNAVTSFVNSFQIAVNPQIVKSYANREESKMIQLIFRSSKTSFFLLFLITYPIIYNIDYILKLWLNKTPPYVSSFVRLCLVNILIDVVSSPVKMGIQATGKIKSYQLIVGLLVFMNLPLSYLLLSFTSDPNHVFYLSIGISLVTINLRLYFLRMGIDFSVVSFYKQVVLKIICVSAIVSTILFLSSKYISLDKNFFVFTIESLIIVLITLFLVFVFGLDREEREFLVKVRNRLFRR